MHARGLTVAKQTAFRNAKVKLREARNKMRTCNLRQLAADAEVEEVRATFIHAINLEADGDYMDVTESEACRDFWQGIGLQDETVAEGKLDSKVVTGTSKGHGWGGLAAARPLSRLARLQLLSTTGAPPQNAIYHA